MKRFALTLSLLACSSFALAETLEEKVDRIGGYTTGNTVGIQTLSDRADSQDAINVQQGQQITEAQGHIQANSEGIQHLGAVTDGHSAMIQQQGQQLNETQANVQRNSQGIESLSQVTNSQGTRLSGVEARATQADLAQVQTRQVVNAQQVTMDQYGQDLANQRSVQEALGTSVAGLYTRTDDLTNQVNGLRHDINRLYEGQAIGLAVAGQQFSTDMSAGFQTAVSASTMKGHQAIAVGIGGAVSERVFINGGIGVSGGTTGGVVSSTFRW